MKQKKTYAAASISDDAKTMIARLYQVQHAQGKHRHEFVADMIQIRDTGIGIPAELLPRTITTSIRDVHSG